MPSTASVAREKDYCDLLYAWLQCNSERENMNDIARRIHKSKVWKLANLVSRPFLFLLHLLSFISQARVTD